MSGRAMRGSQIWIQSQCSRSSFRRARERNVRRRYAALGQLRVRRRETRPRAGEGRVTRDRAIEIIDRLRVRLDGVLDEPLPTFQIKLVCLDVARQLVAHALVFVW